ncbi:cytochrome C oxidase subunit II [Halovivax asiaticus JCM 14624]|uniref:Cytochrome C oxidase subunit II n=1 Tax=Halovivax asiaticus JCM 14624 TaxID=1227490 RepID=M0BEA2_9EURY|nr:cytochrome c oxidase subunit II [Halovivax asiaticus]ELZ08623.1 cytochrome C oxidase subunit II [Halovivax asiaticus JCM 14624]
MTRGDVFELIFQVFMGLGTLVGIVVVLYIMYNAYIYRDDETTVDPKADSRPEVGELPVGGTGGKKLFMSFILSAIIVISLIVWTYGMLLYVEDGPGGIGQGGDIQVQNEEEVDEYLDLEVTAWAFGFDYAYSYQNNTGVETSMKLVIPADTPVAANVSSRDVWHTFGISEFRVKADAIPGEHATTWFEADETGVYDTGVQCYELCGYRHSSMNHDLIVVNEELFAAAMDAEASGTLFDAIQSGELSVDSTPEEFESHIASQESDSSESDSGNSSDDGSGDSNDQGTDSPDEGTSNDNEQTNESGGEN